MNFLDSILLLAQLKAKQPRPGDWAFGWGTVGLIAAAATAIILLAWLILALVRYRTQRTHHSPWRLFHDLAAAHGLSYAERSLVSQLARDLQLDQPAVLFVEPAWWDPDRLPAALHGRTVLRGPTVLHSHSAPLDKLRKRLFAPR